VAGFVTTRYGQAMSIKLMLFLPLLAMGAVNLLLTGQGLQDGKPIWSKRLKVLVGLEIALAIAILAAVGVMTAIAPARITLAARDAAPPPPENHSFFEMAFDDDLMVHFSIEPGTVGDNTFFVDLYNLETGEVLTDASLIRLRFEAEDANLGESELRPELNANGRYVISGSNLSLAGAWRIRMTIQRPEEFDTVVDFEPSIISPEPAPPVPEFNPTPPTQSRALALICTGIAGILMSLVFLLRMRPITLNPQTLLTIVFLKGSIIILQSGIQILGSL
jgi:hypothetical protein